MVPAHRGLTLCRGRQICKLRNYRNFNRCICKVKGSKNENVVSKGYAVRKGFIKGADI